MHQGSMCNIHRFQCKVRSHDKVCYNLARDFLPDKHTKSFRIFVASSTTRNVSCAHRFCHERTTNSSKWCCFFGDNAYVVTWLCAIVLAAMSVRILKTVHMCERMIKFQNIQWFNHRTSQNGTCAYLWYDIPNSCCCCMRQIGPEMMKERWRFIWQHSKWNWLSEQLTASNIRLLGN